MGQHQSCHPPKPGAWTEWVVVRLMCPCHCAESIKGTLFAVCVPGRGAEHVRFPRHHCHCQASQMVSAFLAISSLLPKGSVVAFSYSEKLLTEFSTKSKAVLDFFLLPLLGNFLFH